MFIMRSILRLPQDRYDVTLVLGYALKPAAFHAR